MSLTPLPRPEDRGPIDNPDFWLQDLRLGRYAELVRHLDDPAYRAERVTTWFRTKRILAYVGERLGLATDGSVNELRDRLVAAGRDLLPYLAVAAFAPHKLPVAILDAASTILPPEDLAASQDGKGQYDRLLLLLRILDARPEALAHVRGMHIWHRNGGAALTLAGRPPHRKIGFLDFLHRDNVERAIAGVRLPRAVPGVRFEMTIPRPGGDVIVVLRRNLRRAHHWSDDGRKLSHGHDEELIVLHFADQGRRVRVSAKTAELPRKLAEAIATAWFQEECTYVDDLAPAEPASLRRMVEALVTRQVEGLRLVDLAVRSAPLKGSPELVLRASSLDGEIAEAIYDFEERVGPLGRIAIELKYLTRAHRAEVDGDVFSLREQSAHDVRRYDVVKDVERLERWLTAGVADHGVAVVLTNVAAFWAPSAARNTFDRSFRIHEDATLEGTLDWAPGTGDGTKKNRDKPLVLRGSYRMSWVDYATVGTGPASSFRALVVPVGG